MHTRPRQHELRPPRSHLSHQPRWESCSRLPSKEEQDLPCIGSRPTLGGTNCPSGTNSGASRREMKPATSRPTKLPSNEALCHQDLNRTNCSTPVGDIRTRLHQAQFKMRCAAPHRPEIRQCSWPTCPTNVSSKSMCYELPCIRHQGAKVPTEREGGQQFYGLFS